MAVYASLPDVDTAREQLLERLDALAAAPDTEFLQCDSDSAPVDFFTQLAPADRPHPTFRVLTSEERYSPARGLIAAMMRSHEDATETSSNSSRETVLTRPLWELYLFATFNELGYGSGHGDCDTRLRLDRPSGRIAIEATTANAPGGGAPPPSNPSTPEEFTSYLQDYVPTKITRAVTRKAQQEITLLGI